MHLPRVSVIVPTLNEAENLPALVDAISAVLRWRGYELLIIDDGSTDATVAICGKLARSYPLRLCLRKGASDGLAGAVVEGLRRAAGEYLIVMDADLQHPPAAIPRLLAPLEKDEADFVIGSRYAEGGSIDENWSLGRRFISRFATLLARPLVGNVRDPMAGFFALKRSTFASARDLSPLGYKIALELLCKCGARNVREIPIRFGTRRGGDSKMSLREPIRYLRHLGRLYARRFPLISPAVRFGFATAAVALAALGIDIHDHAGTCQILELIAGDSQTSRLAA